MISETQKRIDREQYNRLTDKIIGIAINVHKQLGPGFVERIYQKALVHEFNNNKINFEYEKQIKVKYKNIELGLQQIDFLIDDKVIVETKSVFEINDINVAQILSYLKTYERGVGLILNFAKPRLEIKRVVNNF